MTLEFILPLVWAGLIGFIIIMYVILDGFDLGIGILFPFINNANDRNLMMSTASPVWDGNETWMVLGGASLYGAFPLAYSTLLPVLYMPIMIMLAALIFRGVAFEFSFKAHRSRFLWHIAFAVGSILSAFMQGVILGTYIKGYPSVLTAAGLHSYSWVSIFSLTTGVGVVCGYALLGSTWLINKTSGKLQGKMFLFAKIALVAVAGFLLLISLWTPYMEQIVFERWFTVPNIYYLSFLPIITGGLIIYLFYALLKSHEKRTFLLTVFIFMLSYLGIVIAIFPYIIPHRVDIWAAAAPVNSQLFILVAVVILLPVLIGYTIYTYRIFRGKVEHGDYHY